MTIFFAPSYAPPYKKLIKNNPRLKTTIKEKIELFISSPNHPSLRLHKLTGSPYDDWSISLTDDLRIIFSYAEDGVLFTDIGSHDEVY